MFSVFTNLIVCTLVVNLFIPKLIEIGDHLIIMHFQSKWFSLTSGMPSSYILNTCCHILTCDTKKVTGAANNITGSFTVGVPALWHWATVHSVNVISICALSWCSITRYLLWKVLYFWNYSALGFKCVYRWVCTENRSNLSLSVVKTCHIVYAYLCRLWRMEIWIMSG